MNDFYRNIIASRLNEMEPCSAGDLCPEVVSDPVDFKEAREILSLVPTPERDERFLESQGTGSYQASYGT